MRGDIFQNVEVTTPVSTQDMAETAKAPEASTNLSENMKPAVKGSVWFWLILLVLYFVWDWIQNRNKVKESLEPSNIRANVHNLMVIGLGAVVFFNGFNVLLTKLASMRIPIISKTAGSILPLFHV